MAEIIKIGLIGPSGSGKTAISDFYAGVNSQNTLGEYVPSNAMRILETEKNNIPIQIWDVSGSPNMMLSLNKICNVLDVVILVIPANYSDTESIATIKLYLRYANKNEAGTNGHIAIFSHKSGGPMEGEFLSETILSNLIPYKAKIYQTSLDPSPDQICGIIDELVESVNNIRASEHDKIIKSI